MDLGKILGMEMLGEESGEMLIRDLLLGRGYGYHGGPWRDIRSWRYCLKVPRYSLRGYLSLEEDAVLGSGIGNFRKYRQVEWIKKPDGIRLYLDGGEDLEFLGENKLEVAYSVYAASLLEEKAFEMPCLRDLVNVYDLDESYRGESTIVLDDYAEYLETGKFAKYFRPVSIPGILGRIQLMEGEFWVRSLKVRPVKSSRWRVQNMVELGGVICRLS